MATAQQIQFAETIRAMKVALKRRRDDSDDDDDDGLAPTLAPNNRGQKLSRRARYARQGRLDDTGGLRAYRRAVEHAGYTRHIIAARPARYDGLGAPWSPAGSDNGDNNDDEAPPGVEPAFDDPFADVRIEELLRPLTSAAELQHHPGLSVAYTSAALTGMVEQTLAMVRQEKETLWKAKRLMQRLRGDGDWLPCEVFEGEDDEALLDREEEEEEAYNEDGETSGEKSLAVGGEVQTMDGVGTADLALAGEDNASRRDVPAAEQKEEREAADVAMGNGLHTDDPTEADATALVTLENPTIANMRARSRDLDAGDEMASESGRETNGTNGPSHSMTTRARARSPAQSERASPSPSDSASMPSVSRWFLAPAAAVPDRDLGLPSGEAEETRRLLLLYVQKQENVVRALESLYSGLQKTDRVRSEIWRACKAEGHMRDGGRGQAVTEMSDGEDWYDVADWNLQPRELKMGKDGTLGLEKGKDEVEDVEEEGRRGAGRRRRVNRM